MADNQRTLSASEMIVRHERRINNHAGQLKAIYWMLLICVLYITVNVIGVLLFLYNTEKATGQVNSQAGTCQYWYDDPSDGCIAGQDSDPCDPENIKDPTLMGRCSDDPTAQPGDNYQGPTQPGNLQPIEPAQPIQQPKNACLEA